MKNSNNFNKVNKTESGVRIPDSVGDPINRGKPIGWISDSQGTIWCLPRLYCFTCNV